jgi:DNA-binding NarL/FixJ family response regulator
VAAVDASTLGNLRAIVRYLADANARQGPSLPEVVKLAREVQVQSGITVDFEATPELGQPLVVVRMPSADGPPSSAFLSLTPREQAVAGLIADGLSNKQIARRLGISVGTVKHYVHQILQKTGLTNRVAIATEAKRR